MKATLCRVLLLAVILATALPAATVGANPPAPGQTGGVLPPDSLPAPSAGKPYDQPEPLAHQRLMERQRLLESGQIDAANALAITGTDRVLVILVEFAGSDTVTWNTGDTWDPLGIANENEWTGTVGDCSRIITQTRSFTYTGPLHNQIPRPLSASDRSGTSIWTENFSPQWFTDFMFGNGVVFDYLRQDGSHFYANFTGYSVDKFYEDLSANQYHINGDVVGWLGLPHSEYWYGADQCPGARSIPASAGASASNGGQLPGGGTSRSFVTDALDAVNAISNTIPGFNWANYDTNGDGVIDRLWLVHSGYGEEDSTTLLNRTNYGEGALWSHSSSLSPAYPVGGGISAGPYIRMPENGGIGVFAHEYGHNLGADDLYSYSGGDTSAGFWTTMADDWTGYPIGYLPPAMDPWHLDNFGWLNPLVISDPTQVYTATIGQASNFPGGAGVYRGVKIQLPDGQAPLPVTPWQGSWFWFGGKSNLSNGMMTLANPIALGAGTSATLTFDLAYDLEPLWDFLWVQASTDGGTTWTTLTNADTSCNHDPAWIGGLYGFPADLCAAGIGGFTGFNPEFPAPRSESFNLAPYLGQSIKVRFWYMTDWATLNTGPFMDSVQIRVNGATIFSDDAEVANANWVYDLPWQRSNGNMIFTHNYYVQWRNTSATGGYDQALGDARWRYGPANTGLLMWYNNNFYQDNEIPNYLFDWPTFGPKGRMLVLDAHPAPYQDPYWVSNGYANEGGTLASRGMMRDATFSLNASVNFTQTPPAVVDPLVWFPGRPAASLFDDSRAYYPGAEYVSRGPGYVPPSWKWVTKQWDTSAAVPGSVFYPLDAPGYVGQGTGQQEFRYRCSRVTTGGGRLSCYWLGTNTGLGYNGGTGAPGDYGAAYGWHVQVLSQTDTTANVKIWNTHYAGALLPDKTVAAQGQTVHFTYTLDKALSAMNPLDVCVAVNDVALAYVTGSVTGGATASGTPCGPASETPRATTYIRWTGAVPANGNMTFGYDATIVPASGSVTQGYAVDPGTGLFKVLSAPPIAIVAAASLPVAAFTPSATAVAPGTAVNFTNLSTGLDPKAYVWYFGDAKYSTLTNPSHTYAAAGTYTVTLTVSNQNGSDTANAVIHVLPVRTLLPVAFLNAAADRVNTVAAESGALPLGGLALLASIAFGVWTIRRRR